MTGLTEEELVDRFERGAVPGDSFHHADHVQLAFAYLSKYPVLDALGKFVNSLKQFAATHGKDQLYNETITFAFFFLIRERMVRSAGSDWQQFCAANPGLLVWKGGILNRYYQEATLKSDLARTVFLFPDKAC